MASSIVFDYDKMEATRNAIENAKNAYSTARTAFENEMEAAIASWEGESKNKLKIFLEQQVKSYMESTENAIATLGQVLAYDITTMQNADNEIAKTISPS